MSRPRRTRHELVVEVWAITFGAAATIVAAVVLFADAPVIQRLRIATIAVPIFAAVLALSWLTGRRRRRDEPVSRLGQADRKALRQALDGAVDLPTLADESWRPELRKEVLDHSFLVTWARCFPLLIAVMLVTPTWSGDRELSDLGVLDLATIIGSCAAISAVVAWGALRVTRSRARNAVSMLEQLDARTTE